MREKCVQALFRTQPLRSRYQRSLGFFGKFRFHGFESSGDIQAASCDPCDNWTGSASRIYG